MSYRDDPLTADLRWYANMVSGLYDRPVYLVGSALRISNLAPRDWDVRLCLSDENFALRYEPLSGLTEGGAADVVVRWWSEVTTGCVRPYIGAGQTRWSSTQTGAEADRPQHRFPGLPLHLLAQVWWLCPREVGQPRRLLTALLSYMHLLVLYARVGQKPFLKTPASYLARTKT
jgi:hypothetical protein